MDTATYLLERNKCTRHMEDIRQGFLSKSHSAKSPWVTVLKWGLNLGLLPVLQDVLWSTVTGAVRDTVQSVKSKFVG